MAALERHTWPGNVRELRNEIERAAIHADGPLVDAHDLSPRLGGRAAGAGHAGPEPGRAVRGAGADGEALVEQAIARAKGNLSEAARLLGSALMIKRRAGVRAGRQGGLARGRRYVASRYVAEEAGRPAERCALTSVLVILHLHRMPPALT